MDHVFRETISNALRYLESIGLQFHSINEDPKEWIILGVIPTNIGEIRLSTVIRQSPRVLITYIYHPISILKPSRQKASEFVTRSNYGLPLGNFELDMEDGELRFKLSIPFFKEAIPLELIRFSINTALSTLSYYHTPLVQILYNDVQPRIAIQLAEKAPKSETSP